MSCVALLLTEALDREWDAQSARCAPLERTMPVRTALELVLGIFPAARATGETPEQLVDSVRDDLPAEVSPWARRLLGRLGALRRTTPLLEPEPTVYALPPASEPLPLAPADIPELPPAEPPEPEPEPEPPLPVPARKRSLLARIFRRRR